MGKVHDVQCFAVSPAAPRCAALRFATLSRMQLCCQTATPQPRTTCVSLLARPLLYNPRSSSAFFATRVLSPVTTGPSVTSSTTCDNGDWQLQAEDNLSIECEGGGTALHATCTFIEQG